MIWKKSIKLKFMQFYQDVEQQELGSVALLEALQALQDFIFPEMGDAADLIL